MYSFSLPQLQNSVPEAAEQRAGQAEEPELVHGVRRQAERGKDWDGLLINIKIKKEE